MLSITLILLSCYLYWEFDLFAINVESAISAVSASDERGSDESASARATNGAERAK